MLNIISNQGNANQNQKERYHLTPTKVAKIKESESNEY